MQGRLPGSIVCTATLSGYARSVVASQRTLTPVGLYATELRSHKVSAKVLLHGPPAGYPQTRLWPVRSIARTTPMA